MNKLKQANKTHLTTDYSSEKNNILRFVATNSSFPLECGTKYYP